MGNWSRFVSAAGAARIIIALGMLEIAMAAARIALWEGRSPVTNIVATDLLIAIPGAVLILGAYRMADTDLRPEVYPRIVTRTLTGVAVMLGLVGLMAISTGLNRPVFTPMAGIALGSVAGFGIGLNEARALSRAYEAEQRKEELREERDLRRRVFDTSPVGITVLNADGTFRDANEHASDILGHPREDILDLEFDSSLFDATDDKGNPIEEPAFETVLRTGDAVYDVELQIRRRDGERIWVLAHVAPLQGPSGEVTGVVYAFEDITERKELETELKDTVEKLEASNERLEQFAYAASHDLQEPLRMVSSYLQLLEDRYTDDLDEDAEEFIGFAVDGADRMRAMIESLLEYSRVSTEGNPLEPTDSEAIFEDVLNDLQLRIEETEATITADELPTVSADRDQLAQVFQNLLSNALRYSGDEPPEVHVSAERTDGLWQFSVADEGIGIDPEYHDRIFTVFERLQSDEAQTDASGIGLALCERIVERHGGDIWLESEPGEGTTFYFTVPAAQDERETLPASHRSAE